MVRAYDELSSAELIKHKKEVDEAKAKELKSWVDMGTCIVEPRGKTGNLVKSRWVLRWKKFHDGSRGVKARLVVKGFQDSELRSLISQSPTANRDSQKIINSIAAIKGWSIFVTDISTAFL